MLFGNFSICVNIELLVRYYPKVVGDEITWNNAFSISTLVVITFKSKILPVTADILSAVNESQGYAFGRGNDGSIYKYDAFGGVWVSDGNGGTVKIGDDGGYYNPE